MVKSKICKRVFGEIAVSPNRKGKPIFSLCCYMNRHAWFRASSIREALNCKKAMMIRENAINNIYGFCSEGCPNWEKWNGSELPKVSVDRFEISASTRCNARCLFCFQADYNLALPESIIEEWRTDYLPSVKKVAFGGGEPLLVAYNLIKEVAEKRPDAKISLVSNGILLDKIIPFKDHVSGINISLNAGSRDVYKTVMNVDAFDRVVSNIRLLKKEGYNGPISSTYVICRENINDIENFLSVCKEVGLTKAGFNIDKTDPFLHVVPHDLSKHIKQYAQELNIKVSIGILDLPLSVIGKGKQMFLYFLRYRPRRQERMKRRKGL